ncbi:MAG: hypothetical protein Q8R36_02770 [bacterium]|nr:hypothetical protein [bacterium]
MEFSIIAKVVLGLLGDLCFVPSQAEQNRKKALVLKLKNKTPSPQGKWGNERNKRKNIYKALGVRH